ncbi:MAG: lipopolysaccharide biosynthesis protein [Carboxylicivirga sp.]|nr:lipopolysaccharide biosynthesis protein [Carboxylicivirga sp.]
MEDIKRKTFRGVFWLGAGRFGTQISQFVVSVILARLLDPKDFGLVAMVAVFTAIGGALAEGGAGAALIQKKNINKIEESSVFYINIAIALVVTLCLIICSNFISDFYKEPELFSIIQALSCVVLIESIGTVPRSLLSKQLEYKIPAKIEVYTSFISGAVGIFLAFGGYGVWALVIQQLLGSTLRVTLLFVIYSWRPLWEFSFSEVLPLFKFGSKFLIHAIVHAVYNNMYRIIIGKVYSMTDLGFFQRARSIDGLIKGNTGGLIEHIMYPYLSTVNDDLERFRKSFSQGLKFSSLVLFPIMIGAIVVAKDLIIALVSDKWLASVPMFQILGVITLVNTFTGFNLKAIAALGNASQYLYIELVNKVLLTVSIFVSFKFGIVMMLYANLILSTIPTFIITIVATKKKFGYGIKHIIKDMYKIMAISGVMAIFVYCLTFMSVENSYVILSLQVCVGMCVYCCGIYLVDKNMFVSVLNLIKNK